MNIYWHHHKKLQLFIENDLYVFEFQRTFEDNNFFKIQNKRWSGITGML